LDDIARISKALLAAMLLSPLSPNISACCIAPILAAEQHLDKVNVAKLIVHDKVEVPACMMRLFVNLYSSRRHLQQPVALSNAV